MIYTLGERISTIERIFEDLQSTNSRTIKEAIIRVDLPEELKEDFQFCIEVLTGKHKLYYTYYKTSNDGCKIRSNSLMTIKDLYHFLLTPYLQRDLSLDNIHFYVSQTSDFADFLEPLCNRGFKLGIGTSLLEPLPSSPMLAKKYEGQILRDRLGFYVTEKLDGNRCIAYCENGKWIFKSRNGKIMHVNFDMSGLPTHFIYDGEVISPEQNEMSEYIYNAIADVDVKNAQKWSSAFNKTSGLINSFGTDKSLIYKIFDIVDDETPYQVRRNILNRLEPKSDEVKILPVLLFKTNESLQTEELYETLDKITSIGGEGLMINLGSKLYEHKRVNSLLKFKKVQSMDMVVTDVCAGHGKYEGLIGAIECRVATSDGKLITVNVGSGLSDHQRLEWIDKSKIIGKIVEVQYFDISQNKNSRGNTYSLRFPRLKCVRTDKNTTSEV